MKVRSELVLVRPEGHHECSGPAAFDVAAQSKALCKVLRFQQATTRRRKNMGVEGSYLV